MPLKNGNKEDVFKGYVRTTDKNHKLEIDFVIVPSCEQELF